MNLIRFGPFELNQERNELRKSGVKIPLNSQSLKVLRLLLSQPGQVITRQQLRRELWTDSTFVDYDHGLNVAVSRLRERLGDSAETAHYIETLAGQGYRFVGTLKPDLETSEPATPDPSLSPAASPFPFRKNRYSKPFFVGASIVVATLAIVSFGFRMFRDVSTESIALLPLENYSEAQGQDYLSDGMTDQLVTELGKFRALQVISSSSTHVYRKAGRSPSQIGKDLGVSYLVEGSVARFADQIRVNARLTRCADGRQLWSSSYSGSMNDLFAMQRDVAYAVASGINGKIVGTRTEGGRSLSAEIPAAALETYLKGKYIQAKGTKEALLQSIGYFEQAIQISPAYADAYTALGESYCSMSTIYAPPREVMPKARAAAEKALSLDQSSAEANSLLARVENLYDWNWKAADAHSRRAVELNPSNASARVTRGTFLACRNRISEANAETEMAHQLDPLSLDSELVLELNLFDTNQTDILERFSKRALQFDPSFSMGKTLLGWTCAQRGLLREGLDLASKAVHDSPLPFQVAVLGSLNVMNGRREVAIGLLNSLLELRKSEYVCAHEIASVQAALGMKKEAIDSLNVALADRSDCLPFLHLDPAMKTLATESAFQALLARIEADHKNVAF